MNIQYLLDNTLSSFLFSFLSHFERFVFRVNFNTSLAFN